MYVYAWEDGGTGGGLELRLDEAEGFQIESKSDTRVTASLVETEADLKLQLLGMFD